MAEDEPRISAHTGPRVRPSIGKVRRGEPTTRCAEPPPPALRQGVAEFNRGQFFEQHETLEAAWIAETDPVRYLYQGILQIGVGFHHLSRGNPYGARRLWGRGMALLQSFRGGCLGVDVDRLIQETEACQAELERLGDAGWQAFDRTLIPRVHWLTDQSAPD
jgi:predicted metal-dependent hydrolase